MNVRNTTPHLVTVMSVYKSATSSRYLPVYKPTASSKKIIANNRLNDLPKNEMFRLWSEDSYRMILHTFDIANKYSAFYKTRVVHKFVMWYRNIGHAIKCNSCIVISYTLDSSIVFCMKIKSYTYNRKCFHCRQKEGIS